MDNIPLRGFLSLYDVVPAGRHPENPRALGETFYKKGKLLHADKNIITTTGRHRVAQLISGLSVNFVNAMAIGDGGAPQLDLLTPIVPVLADTALVHELKRSTSVNPVVTGLILTWTATFLTASLTPPNFINPLNQVINEAGMFSQADNNMFSRKTFPSIPFSPADRVGVIAEWQIEVL